jgi:hypothetical protein
MTLKAREFGREITNASSQHGAANGGAYSTKHPSAVITDNAYSQATTATGVANSNNGSFSTHVVGQAKKADSN